MKLKFVYGILLSLIVGAFWFAAGCISERRLVTLEAEGKIPYGPLPKVEVDFYAYTSIDRAFDPKLNLNYSAKFTKAEFEKIILDSLPFQARENFKAYIKETLSYSVEYQIDPFWIISIMMVESGFDLNARSNKDARGLMQIQPETAEHLHQLMGRKYSHRDQTGNNIDVGIFYLKKLYQNFRLNYKLATLAYNIGPNKLKTLIDNNEDLRNSSYLVKVQDSYKLLENNFLLQLKARTHDDSSENLANILYRDEYFTNYPVQSKFFL